MTRPEITAKLSAMLEKKINPNNDPRIYWAKEVTFDYSTNHAVRVDYMKFVPVNNSVPGIEKVIAIAMKSSHLLKISNLAMD